MEVIDIDNEYERSEMDPCGTAQFTDSIFESFPFSLHNCFLSVR